MTWDELQAQHREWVDREYPGQKPELPAIGMVEEAGELLHAALKLLQLELWGPEPRYTQGKLKEELVDAIGDCAVYCCSFCNATGRSFKAVVEASRASAKEPLEACAASLVEAASAASRRPYSDADLVRYIGALRTCALSAGVDFGSAVCRTWEVVRARSRSSAPPAKPVVVCLCGSTRFKEAFINANFRETMAGKVVLSVGWFSHTDATYIPTPEEKAAVDELHLRKVEMADEVLILDCDAAVCGKCGRIAGSAPTACCRASVVVRPYIGESTARELAYARKLRKRVRLLSLEGVRT